MNTKNNRRRQASREKIESVFIRLLQTKEIQEISVRELCSEAQLNRSTFYANYVDIYGLADSIRENLEQEVARLFYGGTIKTNANDWVKLFYHMRDNQLFYNTYFKLGYDTSHDVNVAEIQKAYDMFPAEHMDYRIEFFRAGFNALVKKWLKGGCKESPEEMNAILVNEYSGRKEK